MSLEILETGNGEPRDFNPTDAHHEYLKYVEEVKARWDASPPTVVQPPKGTNILDRLRAWFRNYKTTLRV